MLSAKGFLRLFFGDNDVVKIHIHRATRWRRERYPDVPEALKPDLAIPMRERSESRTEAFWSSHPKLG